MHSTYSANYSDYRQGYRYFPRNLDFDSATTLTGDFYQACKQLIKDKTIALACAEVSAKFDIARSSNLHSIILECFYAVTHKKAQKKYADTIEKYIAAGIRFWHGVQE
jgi:hypothetical protein